MIQSIDDKRQRAKIEILLNGKFIECDAVGSESLEEAKEYYQEHFDYIGSSKVCFINGHRAEYEEPLHFFKYKFKHNESIN